MSENRTDRTTNLGLLALMQSPAGGGPSSGAQGWGWPYWNQLWLDALIAALHEAARTGEALLTAPATGPTVELSSTTGYLPAGLTLEVCQTWVDEWGRETDAGTVSEISTGEAIPDPDTAAALGTPTPAATGFDGGLLEVAYCWIDEMAGESLPSPVAQVDVPYRTAGLQSEVLVTLPAAPVSVGAAGAFIYARHRSGNWVRAAAISDPAEDEVTLDGTWISCFVALPLANSTGAGKAIDITGIEAPAAAALTRFYVRAAGEAWTSGDRRLCISGVDEWDPASIAYPLIYTGAASGLAPGYPPPVSQVFAVRPVDLETEVTGTLPDDCLSENAVTTTDFEQHVADFGLHMADSDVHFTEAEKADRLLSAEDRAALTGGGTTALHKHAGGLGGRAVAQIGTHVAELQTLIESLRASRVRAGLREIHMAKLLLDQFPTLAERLADTMFIELFKDGSQTANGVIAGMEGTTTAASLDMPLSAGSCVFEGGIEDYEGGTVTIPASQTDYKIWWDGEIKKGASWPAGAHAKLCSVNSDGSKITAADNTVRTLQNGLDVANGCLAVAAAPVGAQVTAGQEAGGAQMANGSTYCVMMPFRVSRLTPVTGISFPGGVIWGANRPCVGGILTGDGQTVLATTAVRYSYNDITTLWSWTSGDVLWLQPNVGYLAGMASTATDSVCGLAYTTGSPSLAGSLVYPEKKYLTKTGQGLAGTYSTIVADRYLTVKLWSTLNVSVASWRSQKVTLPVGKRIARLLPSTFVSPAASRQYVDLTASFDGGLTWEALTEGVEKVPDASAPTSIQMKVELENYGPAMTIEDIGVLWETE